MTKDKVIGNPLLFFVISHSLQLAIVSGFNF